MCLSRIPHCKKTLRRDYAHTEVIRSTKEEECERSSPSQTHRLCSHVCVSTMRYRRCPFTSFTRTRVLSTPFFESSAGAYLCAAVLIARLSDATHPFIHSPIHRARKLSEKRQLEVEKARLSTVPIQKKTAGL